MKQVSDEEEKVFALKKQKRTMQMGSNKMQMRNQTQRTDNLLHIHQQQAGAKWGDWSECSVDCLKTRHRKNCEDLLAAQNSSLLSGEQQINTSSNAIRVAGKRQVNGDDSINETGNDDEDYAEEPDEEIETDTCDKVEGRKTMQQIPCTGGLCRFSSAHFNQPDQAQLSPLLVQRLRDQVRSRRPGAEQKGETNPLSTLLEEQFSSRPRNTNNGNSRLSDNFGWLNHKPNRHQHHANQATTSSSVEARQAIMKLPNSNSNSNSNSDVTLEEFLTESGQTSNPTSGATTTTTTTVSDNSSTSGWTKSMWPQHLLTGITTTSQQDNFSQPATQLIQWTILIGSLLSLILLIMLILRKLFVSTFPSYQWMLAKQTLKSTSKLNHHHQTATPDCCQASSYSRGGQQRHLTGSVMPACVTVNPSSGLFGFKSRQHQHHLHFQQANLAKNQLPPHHMCHAWRQQQAANVEGGSNSGKQIRQATIGQSYTVLNANGNHILSSSFAPTFNTDIYDLPGSFAQESARSMTNSSSASYKPRMNNNNNSLELLENEVHSVISANYNYDTLNSNYGNGVEQHTCKEEDKGFQLSRNYARQELSSFANLTNGGTELAGKRHLNGSLHCNEEPDSSLVGIKKEKKKQRQEKGEFKHGPKVPRRARGQVGDLGRQSSSASSTISGSSQSQSGCDSSLASGSVQSTTAQMISQAASCSFEPEQTSQLELNSGDLQTNINNNGSSISPAISLLGHGASRIVRNGSTKLTGCPSSVQSQPNSPMFANQFTVAKLRQQTGRDLSLPAPNLSSASRLSSLSQTNNKEQDQIDTANHKFEQEQQQQSDIPEQTKHQEAVSGESHCGPGTTNEKQLIIDGFNPKRETLNVTAGNNNNNNIDYCDNQDERHLYEEITNQDQAS